MADTFRFYDEPDGWIECETRYDCMFISAHVNDGGKYSRGMIRKFIEFGKAVGVVKTELKHDYLVAWYNRHFYVTSLGDDLYEIRSI